MGIQQGKVKGKGEVGGVREYEGGVGCICHCNRECFPN